MSNWFLNTFTFASAYTLAKRKADRDFDRKFNRQFGGDDDFDAPAVSGFALTVIFIILIAIVWVVLSFFGVAARNAYLVAFTDNQPLPSNFEEVLRGDVEIEQSSYSQSYQGSDFGMMSVTINNKSDYDTKHINIECTVVGNMGSDGAAYEIPGVPAHSTGSATFQVPDPAGKALDSNCFVVEPVTEYSWWTGLPKDS